LIQAKRFYRDDSISLAGEARDAMTTKQWAEAAPMQKMQQHLAVERYGQFTLPPAIRPSLNLQVVPEEGYRIDVFDDGTGDPLPMLLAAVSQERLFDVFLDLLGQFGPTVDVIIESHHHRQRPDEHPRDFLREHIDLPVLTSCLCDHQELLLGDGCLGVAVVDPRGPSEIQFDDHKVLVVYARNLAPYVRVLAEAGVRRKDSLRVISEAEHLHSTCPKFLEQAESLRDLLGAQ
jgi:hypothetical protein